MPIVFILTKVLSSLTRPFALFGMGFTSVVGGFISPMLISALESFSDKFRSARADSSRVREALGRIAVERWQRDAPIWGHGTVESGPHLVEFMPIGSHHSWFGLLFVKGIVGFFALAIPLLYSLIDLVIKSQTNETARVGLSMVFIIFLYTFGENLEILAYLYWPALIMIGMGFAKRSETSQEAIYET
jgi:hypothetical protein